MPTWFPSDWEEPDDPFRWDVAIAIAIPIGAGVVTILVYLFW